MPACWEQISCGLVQGNWQNELRAAHGCEQPGAGTLLMYIAVC